MAWDPPVLEKPAVLWPPFWAPQTPLPNQLRSMSTRTYRLTSPLQVPTWGNSGTLTSAFPGWQSFRKGSRQAEEKQEEHSEAGQVGSMSPCRGAAWAGTGRLQP